jgi:peroxiredoxin
MLNPLRPAVVLWLCVALPGPAAIAAPREGSIPADFAARALAGGNQRLSEYRGDVLALLFWGTWCGECRASLADVERLRRTYDAAGFAVLGINLDERPEAAVALLRAVGVAFPNVGDAGKRIARDFDVDALPMLVLLDRDGRVRFAASGPRTADAATTDMLRRLLDE